MISVERRRAIIFSVLIVLTAGLSGLLAWKGVPFVRDVLKWQRWQREMRDVVAQREQIEAEWNRRFGPVEDFPKRHPATVDNETATKLDAELAGMDMVGLINTNPVQPATEIGDISSSTSVPEIHPKQYDAPSAVAERATAKVSKRRRDEFESVTNYLNAQIEQPADVITAPDPALVSFMHSKAESLAKIRTLLSGSEAPVWRSDYLHSAWPLVNLLGFMRLNRLLASDSYRAMQFRDYATAQADLKAMTVLNQALAKRPETVSLLVMLAMERYRLATVRMYASLTGEAPQTGEIFDVRAGLREVFIGEAWLSDLHNREVLVEEQKIIAGIPVARRRHDPGLSMSDAWRLDSLRAMTLMFSRTLSADACSMLAPETQHAKPAEWNISGIFIPNTDSISRRVQRYEMENEMTRKVVQLARARLAAGAGELKLPADFAASDCKSGHWLVETSTNDQSITLRFSEPIDWGKNVKGAKIPLQFSLHAPPNLR